LKRARKRAEKGRRGRGFHSPLFPALFCSLFRWVSFSFSAGKFVFSLFNTVYISELKRGKKNPVKNGQNYKKLEKAG
jgi:hypothetical protein